MTVSDLPGLFDHWPQSPWVMIGIVITVAGAVTFVVWQMKEENRSMLIRAVGLIWIFVGATMIVGEFSIEKSDQSASAVESWIDDTHQVDVTINPDSLAQLVKNSTPITITADDGRVYTLAVIDNEQFILMNEDRHEVDHT